MKLLFVAILMFVVSAACVLADIPWMFKLTFAINTFSWLVVIMALTDQTNKD